MTSLQDLDDQWYNLTRRNLFDPEAYGVEPFDPSTEWFRELISVKVKKSLPYYTYSGVLTLDEAIDKEIKRMHKLIKHSWQHHLSQDDIDALVKEGRLLDLTSKWNGKEWVTDPEKPPLTPEIVNRWSFSGMGHDTLNRLICVRARFNRENSNA